MVVHYLSFTDAPADPYSSVAWVSGFGLGKSVAEVIVEPIASAIFMPIYIYLPNSKN